MSNELSASDVEFALKEVLESVEDKHTGLLTDFIRRMETFEEAGVLTRDSGLVLRLDDGTEYQITIVKSK